MKAKITTALLTFASLWVQGQTTVLLSTSNNNIKDAWVWSFDPAEDVNFGEANAFNNGLNNVIRSEIWVWGTPIDTIRGLLDFDLSSIPSSSNIIEAKLSLYYFVNPGYTQQVGANDLLIQRINQSWTETGVVWTNQPSVSTDNQITLPQSSSQTQDYLDIDVTSLVQDMIDNPTTSEGFMLKMANEQPYKGLTFASSENTNSSLHPTLEITYGSSASLTTHDELNQEAILYPNPVSQDVFIDIEMGENALIDVEVFSLSGKKETVSFNEVVKSGQRTIHLNVNQLTSGTYLINLKSDNIIITRTLIVE